MESSKFQNGKPVFPDFNPSRHVCLASAHLVEESPCFRHDTPDPTPETWRTFDTHLHLAVLCVFV